MSSHHVAQALQRARQVLARRPDLGVHDDSAATAVWDGGTQVTTSHADGTRVVSDMPAELGGAGQHITPGWMFRAGMASCTATTLALTAASEGIELSLLEVRVTSRSDTRALLGVTQADGSAVPPAPTDFRLHVRLAAAGASAERLRALVGLALARSPLTNTLPRPTPLAVTVDVAQALDAGQPAAA